MIRLCGSLALFAALVLSGAAVWFGGLNQDEGWYLYAAELVGEGQVPYRDFFYTQGPVLPLVYSFFTRCWESAGLLGARLLTLAFGFTGILCSVALTRLLVPASRRNAAGVIVFLLLGCNLYHLYFLAIPKTYALAALFVQIGFFLLARALLRADLRYRAFQFAVAGFALALAAGTRISLGFLLAAVGFALLFAFRRYGLAFLWFGLGGAFALALVYGPFLIDPLSREGLLAAQAYHAARGGFSPVFTVGSFSRLIRWYLPLFILLGLALHPHRRIGESAPVVLLLFLGFLAVFTVQMLAPFPYEDYQVPIMGLLAVAATALLVMKAEEERLPRLVYLTLGLSFATAFGSPLLEKWTTDAQDRFWTQKKEKCELAMLQEAADAIERLDPEGTTLLTQDLYLAIETNRRVPKGLEMGPFSMMSAEEWRALLTTNDCSIAALSGYSFAIEPPVCERRNPDEVAEFKALVFENFDVNAAVVFERFGQNATTLTILPRARKEAAR